MTEIMEYTITGSMLKDTYNVMEIDGRAIVSIWGKITKVVSENNGKGQSFVCINKTEAFLHNVDRVFVGG